jgi:alpha-glucosidase (family GH31 glycosyl hydrolase)
MHRAPDIRLTSGVTTIDVDHAPFSVTISRGHRRLVGRLRTWARAGLVRDRFLPQTEGVMAREDAAPTERSATARIVERSDEHVVLDVTLASDRHQRLELRFVGPGRVDLVLKTAGSAMRHGVEWDVRSPEHFAGLGARHAASVDHGGRSVQLGADRRYTGPHCPPELLELGGIPQGDYAPVPFLQSSHAYGLCVHSFANGLRFDLRRTVESLAAPSNAVSARLNGGPLHLTVFTAASAIARLRGFLRLTGYPPVLAEWAYGYWKSRDFHEHEDEVFEDLHGCRWHGIPLDAIVLDSPWETNYNSWEPNPHQFPNFEGMVRLLANQGVKTVVWITGWINHDSVDAQMPSDPASRRLHREPSPNYQAGVERGAFVKDPDGAPFEARWWMGTGSPIDFTNQRAEEWWREQAKSVLRLGVKGIKADDGEGYYIPDDAVFSDTTTGADTAWKLGGLYRASMQRALDDVHGPGAGVLFGRCGWTGQQQDGVLWAGDQASDFWSLETLMIATLSAAASGFSNWSHDIGGYLGDRGLYRPSSELLIRWVQLGCFTPLMQAHGRLDQEPWNYNRHTLATYRAYVQLHECLVPYVRAAARTCARSGVPIIRPVSLIQPSDDAAWGIGDSFFYGPSLYVAPVLEEGVTEREVALPPGAWIEAASGRRLRGGSDTIIEAPLEQIPVFVRAGSLIPTYPLEHVALGLGDADEASRPLHITLWGTPPSGRTGERVSPTARPCAGTPCADSRSAARPPAALRFHVCRRWRRSHSKAQAFTPCSPLRNDRWGCGGTSRCP